MGLRSDERGMVLLLVLLVVALLSTLLIEFSYSTLVDLRLAETFRDTMRATYLARGGIAAGQALRSEDGNNYDALNEPWAGGIPVYPVADGSVTVEIEDLGGRIDLNRLVDSVGNINVVVKDRYRLLLQELDVIAQPDALIDPLVDWLDPDNSPEAQGEEGGRYAAAQPPYRCKNGPLDTIDELLLVQGYTPEIVAKLRPHVTLYGNGNLQVNVNTASREVLLALSGQMTTTAADAIISAREGAPITDIHTIGTLPGFDNNVYSSISGYITVLSSYFRVTATGNVNDGRRSIEATVSRDGKQISYQRVL